MASTGQFQICCNGTIGVEIHRSGVMGLFRPTIDAECIAFDTRKIRVTTNANFSVGDGVVMDLQVLDLRVEELAGRVSSASASSSSTTYTIDFKPGMQRDARHCLRQLENLYLQQAQRASA
ncbi:MAG: hypothetical protein AAF515_19320 [Pseudomonadota bacterium]